MNGHLRIARPTNKLDEIVAMYRDGLGLQVIGSFKDHDGFDGVMLGQPGLGYHLEFTHQRGHNVGTAPTQDHLLVFYLPDRAEWERSCQRMLSAGFKLVKAYNPYWDRRGKTFEDPDCYRVVLQNASWGHET